MFSDIDDELPNALQGELKVSPWILVDLEKAMLSEIESNLGSHADKEILSNICTRSSIDRVADNNLDVFVSVCFLLSMRPDISGLIPGHHRGSK